MNKWMVIPALAGVLTIGGVAAAKSDTTGKQLPENILSQEEISTIAQRHAPGTITDVELEHEHGRVVYDIELQEQTIETDLELDATTGDVLTMKQEAVEVDLQNSEQQTVSSVKQTEPTAISNHTLTVVSPSEGKPNQSLLTKKEAVEIAKQHAVGTVTDVDIEKEKEDGIVFYEIEMEDEQFEYEIMMEATTGNIVSFEKD
ncbi:PepSY domain-containing protein [Sporosarcina obsidiansis]|uniref:PepSY domain-containing protein n=1 Tax=Sporosarcina obsidiansis TaxID=2660748 RepID=UPI00129B0048|nr:PepSY domain-containing protein [Sporosarcina obsidiansis]